MSRMAGNRVRAMRWLAGAAASLVVSAAGVPAHAQSLFIPTVIGATIGNMGANRGYCSAGPEALTEWKTESAVRLEGVITTYATAMDGGDRRRARGVFRARSWTDASGQTHDPAQVSPFAASAEGASQVRERTELTMGSDYQSAQGRWSLSTAGESVPQVRFATVDFERDFWGNWKIKRLSLADAAPEPLRDRFCTYAELSAPPPSESEPAD